VKHDGWPVFDSWLVLEYYVPLIGTRMQYRISRGQHGNELD
jgi:hypothetical protein